MNDIATKSEEIVQIMRAIAESEANGRLDIADALCMNLHKRIPNNAHILHTRGIIAHKRKRFTEGRFYMLEAIKMDPTNYIFFRNVTDSFKAANMLDDALNTARKAVELAPHDFASIFNLGVIHMERREYSDALLCAARAEEIAGETPDTLFLKAELNLINKSYEAGWELYEARFDIQGGKGSLPDSLKEVPRWKGQENVTILLLGDQGYGDNMQFMRYIPAFIAKYPTVQIKIGCSAEMVPLFGLYRDIVEGIYSNTQDAMPFDQFLPVSGLPKVVGFKSDDYIIEPAPFASLPESDTIKVEESKNIKIGIVWAGRAAHKNDIKRSMTVQNIYPILAQENLDIYSLQTAPRNMDLTSVPKDLIKAKLYDVGGMLSDWLTTASLIKKLDCVVCVDTAIAHLAGSLGKKVYLMLPYSSDWRWGIDSETTPWYPSMEIIRQPTYGDWKSVIEKVLEKIKCLQSQE
jgi:tetratricopeptide (TPR) repeat protein